MAGTSLRTTDGGANWTKHRANDAALHGVLFTDASTGTGGWSKRDHSSHNKWRTTGQVRQLEQCTVSAASLSPMPHRNTVGGGYPNATFFTQPMVSIGRASQTRPYILSITYVSRIAIQEQRRTI